MDQTTENILKERRDSYLSQLSDHQLKQKIKRTPASKMVQKDYIDKISENFNGSKKHIYELHEELKLVADIERNHSFDNYVNHDQKFRPGYLAEEIQQDFEFKTLKDSGQILIYKNGWWQPHGQQMIEQESVARLGTENFLNNRVNGVKNYIKSSNYVERDNFQPPERKINLRNGVYNLETGQMESHKPENNFTFKINYNYKTGSECPRIDQFLSEITEKEEDKEKLYEIIAYSMLPSNPLNKAAILAGSGENGKTVFIDIVKELLGSRNIVNKSLQDLNDSFDVHDIHGKLSVIDDDLPPTKLRNTDIFKKLTGGSDIGAEIKFGDHYDFQPIAFPIFAANQIPPTPDKSHGFFRRWVLVNFPYQFRKNPNPNDPKQKQAQPRSEMITELTTEEEMEGLLCKCIEKLEELLERNSFKNQRSVEDLRKKWREHSTPITSFFEKYVEQGRTKSEDEMVKDKKDNPDWEDWQFDYLRRDDLQRMIAAYAKKKGATKPSKNKITRRLKDSDLRTGITQTRREPMDLNGGSDRIRVYSGLKISFDKEDTPPYLLNMFSQDSNQSIQVVEDRRNLDNLLEDYIRSNYSNGSVMVDELLDELEEEEVINEDERGTCEDKIDSLKDDGILFEPSPGEVQFL
jgi:P4 family phage/plasmid primase-like protien